MALGEKEFYSQEFLYFFHDWNEINTTFIIFISIKLLENDE